MRGPDALGKDRPGGRISSVALRGDRLPETRSGQDLAGHPCCQIRRNSEPFKAPATIDGPAVLDESARRFRDWFARRRSTQGWFFVELPAGHLHSQLRKPDATIDNENTDRSRPIMVLWGRAWPFWYVLKRRIAALTGGAKRSCGGLMAPPLAKASCLCRGGFCGAARLGVTRLKPTPVPGDAAASEPGNLRRAALHALRDEPPGCRIRTCKMDLAAFRGAFGHAGNRRPLRNWTGNAFGMTCTAPPRGPEGGRSRP